MSNNKNDGLSPKLLFATRLAVLVLVLSGFGLFVFFFQPAWFRFNLSKSKPIVAEIPVEVASTTPPVACPDCERRLLDGVMVKPEIAKLRPFGVMIDNFVSAKPQSGLSAASLVYEAPAEGGITRYEAFFAPDLSIAEIGPIRSARPYFLNWAKEIGATYVHVGGSPDALDLAKNLGKSNLDEFSKSKYFWRSNDRTAPHNVLTSSDNLNKYRADLGETGIEMKPWKFKDAVASSTAPAGQIKIKYTDGYGVYWQYQPEQNDYVRYQDNKLFLDAGGSTVNAKNIIVHIVPLTVSDDKLRLTMSGELSGPALLCQDGSCQVGNWKKNSPSDRAIYYLKNGDEFIFNAGITWVEVVNDWSLVEY